MTVENASRRRDPRFQLRPGAGSVRFSLDSGPDGDHRGDVNQISLGGLGFDMTDGPRMSTGTSISGATIQIGACEIQGDLSVRECRRATHSSIEVACLFYPSSKESEEKWIAVLAGMSAARAD